MKKALMTLAIVLLAVAAQAQIKVHDDGQVSLGSLNKTYGVQVGPNGYTYFRTQNYANYGWANLSMANAWGQQHWIVENHFNNSTNCYKKHMFYVFGNGNVYATDYLSLDYSSNCLYGNRDNSRIGSEEALSVILNLEGYYYNAEPMVTPEEIENNENIDVEAMEGMIGDLEKRNVGLSAENMAEVFPDAVRTDPQARLCIDYQAVTTMLVEAIKQQQAEIILLQKALEENGLMR